MDTQSQDIVSTGATVSNAIHAGGEELSDDWRLSAVGEIYQINPDGTVGYINSPDDVDIYYVPDSVGTTGKDGHGRWVYIVSGSALASRTGESGDGASIGIPEQLVGMDFEFSLGNTDDDPNDSYVENYRDSRVSGSPYLENYYIYNTDPSNNWFITWAANRIGRDGVSGVKYAVASTPQQALSAYRNSASTTESRYGNGSGPGGGSGGGPGGGGPGGGGGGGASGGSHATHSLKYSAEGIVLELPVASDLLFQNADGRVAIWTMAGTNIAGGGVVNANPGTAWQAFGFITGAAFSGSAYNPNLPEILFQNTSSGQIAIWNMNGTNIIGGGTVAANPGPSWRAIGTGDFNHDFSLSDILFQNTSGQIAIWDMIGTNIVGGGTVTANPGPSWHAIGTGEFNDDGHSDILFQNTSGQIAMWDMNGTNIIGGGTVSANPGPAWQAIGTGDFNNDGHSDILFQNPGNGQIAIWEMNGAQIIGGGTVDVDPGPSWHAIGTNGGGSTILFQNVTSGQIAMWDMNGTSIIGGGTVSANPGPTWHASGLT